MVDGEVEEANFRYALYSAVPILCYLDRVPRLTSCVREDEVKEQPSVRGRPRRRSASTVTDAVMAMRLQVRLRSCSGYVGQPGVD